MLKNKTVTWIALSGLLFSLFLISLTACTQPNPTPAPIPETGSETQLPSSTPLPTATQTDTPTPLPSPTPTPPPTLTPTFTATPLPWGEIEINAQNAAGITRLASWGRGRVLTEAETGSDRTIFLSSLGVYLYRSSDMESLAVYPGALRFLLSPDEETLAVLDPDGTIRLVNPDTGLVLQTLPPLSGFPAYLCPDCPPEASAEIVAYLVRQQGLTFSPDSLTLYAAYPDGSIGIWDVRSGSQNGRLYHDVTGSNEQILFPPAEGHLITFGSTLFSYPRKGVLAYWSLESGELLWYTFADGRPAPLFFSPDGSLMGLYFSPAGADYDLIRLYSLADGQRFGEISGSVGDSPYHPSLPYFLTWKENQILIWQLYPTFTLWRTLYPSDDIWEARFSSDGDALLINGGEMIYTFPSLEPSDPNPQGQRPSPTPDFDLPPGFTRADDWTEFGHLSNPMQLSITPEGQLLIHGSWTGLWRYEPFRGALTRLPIEMEEFGSLAFHPDGNLIAVCFLDQLRFYAYEGIVPPPMERCLEEDALAFATHEPLLAFSRRNTVRVFDWTSGEAQQNYLSSGYPISLIRFSADGTYLAAAGEICGQDCLGDLHLWQVNPPRGISLEGDGSQFSVTDLVFSADGKTMIAAKQAVWAWDTESGRLQGRLADFAVLVALSPNGEVLALSDWDGNITLVDMGTKAVLTQFQAHLRSLRDMQFSPDGASLLTLGFDGAVHLWGLPETGD